METILFVVEGRKAESKIVDNIKNNFLGDKIVIKILYGTSIYHLYELLKEDEDFDVVEILREMSDENKKILNGIKRRFVASVFLFFDQDSHSSNASSEKLKDLINKFDDETGNGKLYISYPMVEALRYINSLENRNHESVFYWNINDNKNFKKVASTLIRDFSYLSVYENYNNSIWLILNKFNWKKANLLINNDYSLPDYETLLTFTQTNIYEKQCELMKEGNIIVLSAFPFFIRKLFKTRNNNKIIIRISATITKLWLIF